MKLVKTTLFSGIITFIRILSGFIASKVVAVFTGPLGVALIGQFINFVTVVLAFANGAINMGVVKYTAELNGDIDQLKALFSTAFKISITCSAIVGTILIFSAPFMATGLFHNLIYQNPIRVLGATIILYSLNTLLISILNGKGEIKTYTIVNSIGSLIGLLFTIVLVFYMKVQGALYALVLSQSIIFFVTGFLISRSDWFSWSYFNQSFNLVIAKKLSHFTLMAVVSSITLPIAQIVLRNYLTKKLGINSAGYWQGMMRISDGYLLLITTALGTYYLPKLASLKENKELNTEIYQGYKIIIPAVTVSCLLIFLLRIWIIKVLYTSEFIEMKELFFYQLIGDFFKIAAWILAYLMLAKSMTRTFIVTEVFFTLSYIFISVLCIDRFKLQGISIAFAINYFLYFLIMVLIFRKLLFLKHE